MSNVLGIVQVRYDASPSKVARKLGGKSLIEWVVRRITDCQTLDQVVVVLSGSQHDRRVAELVPPDVPVFIGSAPDMLGRFIETVDAFGCESVMRVCADNPFVDPVLVDSLANIAAQDPGWDYVGYCSGDGQPAICSPLGVYAEWLPVETLRRANREAKDPRDRDEVSRYVYTRPDRFRVQLVCVPSGMDRQDVRLKVELEEDWENAQAIFDALGPDGCDWQRIAGLLDQQPALRKRMEVLNGTAPRP